MPSPCARGCAGASQHYYLSEASQQELKQDLHVRDGFVLGEIVCVHKERVAGGATSPGGVASGPNPYGLAGGTEYHVLTVELQKFATAAPPPARDDGKTKP